MTSVIVVCFSVAVATAIAASVQQVRQHKRTLQFLLHRLLRKRKDE